MSKQNLKLAKPKRAPIDTELLRQAVSETSGDLEYPFNLRQLFYQLNKLLREAGQSEFEWEDFKRAIVDFEKREGSIPCLLAPEKAPLTAESIPYHVSTLHLPSGQTQEIRTYPIAKAKGRFYCKYCYTTHRDWWQMDSKDYSLA
jgi:hypothetical protein